MCTWRRQQYVPMDDNMCSEGRYILSPTTICTKRQYVPSHHCWRADIDPILKFQQWKYCCWPNVGPTTTHQQWILSSGDNNGPTHVCRL